MGQNIQRKVREGDCLIVATDGLYDNVTNEEIRDYVSQMEDPMSLAEQLGDLASKRGMDKTFRSPFMAAASEAGVAWKGGKADDVTVVIARIVPFAQGNDASLLSTIPEAAVPE